MMAGMTYDCTQCHRPYTVQSPYTTLYVCPGCAAILTKDDKSKGTFAPKVPEHLSLLKIGSQLNYEGVNYRFIGVCHFQLIDGYRNKWILSNDKGEIAYMFESLGYYAICKKWPYVLSTADMKDLNIGSYINLKDIPERLYVDGMDKNELTAYEGELEMNKRELEPFFMIDLSNNQGSYACIQLFDKKEAMVYTGRYGNFSDFKFSDIKLADGWQ